MSKPYTIAENVSDEIRDALGDLPELIKQLLGARGVTKREDADAFLNPDYETHTHDPFLFRNMQKAVARIVQAIEKNERVAIYSDFDADGIPGGVILHDLFKKIGYEHVTNYIPHRSEEGYGFHEDAVQQLAKSGVSLIITVDVGIADVQTVSSARELGIDVILTDHHLPQETLPKAYATLNPHLEGETYPYKDLCGAGVAFKLTQALLLHMREHGAPPAVELPPEGWEKWLLDLVAIATVADMVPLTGENRTLAYWGLIVLRKSPRKGVHALCSKLRINQQYLTEDDIGFSIAPRINAASRMDAPEDAFTLLATGADEEAATLAARLESLNNKRKGAVAAIVRELKDRFTHDDAPVLVAGNPKWNPALLGLAANSLSDKYGKSVCLWGREGTGALKGSCRGNGNTHILKLFENAQEVLAQYGGHEHAGGFTVREEKIHELPQAFAQAHAHACEDDTTVAHCVDGTLHVREASNGIVPILAHMRPFGIGNAKPLFVLQNVHITNVREFGKESTHIELTLQDENGMALRANKFFATAESFSTTPQEGARADVIGTLEESRFGGRYSVEIRIVDIF